jgi:hypothetical protein
MDVACAWHGFLDVNRHVQLITSAMNRRCFGKGESLRLMRGVSLQILL